MYLCSRESERLCIYVLGASILPFSTMFYGILLPNVANNVRTICLLGLSMGIVVKVKVFNATFNNMSAISWWYQ